MALAEFDAPDGSQVLSGAAFDAPDSATQSAQTIFDYGDRSVWANVTAFDAPDSSKSLQVKAFNCPDGAVTGSASKALLDGKAGIGIVFEAGASTVYPHALVACYALLLKGTTVIDWDQLSLSVQTDKGWDWSATLPATQSIDLYSPDLWHIVIYDGLGFSVSSPPLVARPREEADLNGEMGPSITVSGVDITTYKLGTPNQSWPTFKNVTSLQVLQTFTSSFGVTFAGALSFPVPAEDVKQQLLADAVNHFKKICAQESYIDEQGVVQLRAWDDIGGPLEVDWSDIKHRVDPFLFKTSIKIGKHSPIQGNSIQGEFDFPFTDVGFKSFPLPSAIRNPVAIDRSTLGFVDLVAFWDADPTKPGAGLVSVSQSHQGLGLNLPSPNSNKPAVWVTCFCFNPGGTVQIVIPGIDPKAVVCLLHVKGSPIGGAAAAISKTDPEFMYPYAPPLRSPYSSGSAPVWPAPDTVDSLYPTRSWVQGIAPNALAMASKGWDKLSMDAVLHANVRLRQRFVYNAIAYKVDTIRWTLGSNSLPSVAIELERVS